jgi:pimeloyl-ACP methyl ester carboxylesterase
MTETAAGTLRPAGDIHMYVEIEGDGPDLVLLHGGGGTVDDLAGIRAVLGPGHRIIAPEQRAHGRTPDIGELRYAQMAADTAALLDGLGVRSADLVGWSDGGIIALIVARDRPELVGHVVAIGANVDSDGAPDPMSEASTDWFANATPADLDFDMSVEAKTKLLAMWGVGPEITVADLPRVTPPVLLIAGDRDLVTLEHTVAMFTALPDAKLAIIPGADHHVPQARPDTVAALIMEFLDGTPKRQAGR